MVLSNNRSHKPGGEEPLETIEPAVLIREVHVFLGKPRVPVLDLDNLRVQPGEQLVIIGPSGAGKTTLLRMINSYIRQTSGVLRVFGRDISCQRRLNSQAKRKIGFIFQNFNLVTRATVFDNVLWGRLGYMNTLSIAGIIRQSDRSAAFAALEEVDLIHLRDRRIDQISGGEQQRVGIARVLAQEAELILADEPVSNLDPELADDIMGLLVALCSRHKRTLIASLHLPDLAKRYGQRIVGIKRGKISFDITPENLTERHLQTLYQRPQPLPFKSKVDLIKNVSNLP